MFHLLFSIKKHPKSPNYEDDDIIGSYQAVINPFDENRSGLSPLPPELVALNYSCDANHDISLAIVTRPSFKELKRERSDISHGS
ncbi:hypothetical protein SLEP1_g40361 [Rubroshorea leprosula]|uniref:Uncharacterized protein n=1 Tax=Rubroshorea leprosula TaxID=152421 RepID=A0AAV5L360_9ROSI|nr:hypothetical protein SLEP1_g40361 [Rubroshorea leprosula]